VVDIGRSAAVGLVYQGLGTEAVRLASRWVLTETPLYRLDADVEPSQHGITGLASEVWLHEGRCAALVPPLRRRRVRRCPVVAPFERPVVRKSQPLCVGSIFTLPTLRVSLPLRQVGGLRRRNRRRHDPDQPPTSHTPRALPYPVCFRWRRVHTSASASSCARHLR